MEEFIDKSNTAAIQNDRKQHARNMLKDAILSYEQIAKYTDLSLDEVKALAAQ